MSCRIDGCEQPEKVRGWCKFHYMRQWRYGDPLWEPPTADERFSERVDRDGPLPTWAPFLGPCWIWTGTINTGGYGVFAENGNHLAHRWAYERFAAPIPEGLDLDHLCRVITCVNPAHLEPVTNAENLRRSCEARGVREYATHCPQGHEYTEENTYYRKVKGRDCRTCKRANDKAYQERQRKKRAA